MDELEAGWVLSTLAGLGVTISAPLLLATPPIIARPLPRRTASFVETFDVRFFLGASSDIVATFFLGEEYRL